MYTVYLLECAGGTLYTGITTDLSRRFKEHCAGTASRYTKAHKASKIHGIEKLPDRSSALKREAAIKRLSREEKLKLIR